jgi:hypothetical protein
MTASLPNPFESQTFALETQLDALALIASAVLKRIATDARQVHLTHTERADLARVECLAADLLFAIKSRS